MNDPNQAIAAAHADATRRGGVARLLRFADVSVATEWAHKHSAVLSHIADVVSAARGRSEYGMLTVLCAAQRTRAPAIHCACYPGRAPLVVQMLGRCPDLTQQKDVVRCMNGHVAGQPWLARGG